MNMNRAVVLTAAILGSLIGQSFATPVMAEVSGLDAGRCDATHACTAFDQSMPPMRPCCSKFGYCGFGPAWCAPENLLDPQPTVASTTTSAATTTTTAATTTAAPLPTVGGDSVFLPNGACDATHPCRLASEGACCSTSGFCGFGDAWCADGNRLEPQPTLPAGMTTTTTTTLVTTTAPLPTVGDSSIPANVEVIQGALVYADIKQRIMDAKMNGKDTIIVRLFNVNSRDMQLNGWRNAVESAATAADFANFLNMYKAMGVKFLLSVETYDWLHSDNVVDADVNQICTDAAIVCKDLLMDGANIAPRIYNRGGVFEALDLATQVQWINDCATAFQVEKPAAVLEVNPVTGVPILDGPVIAVGAQAF